MIELYRKEIEAILLLEAERQLKANNFGQYLSKTGFTIERNVDVHKTLWCEQKGDFRDFYNLLISTPHEPNLVKVVEFYRPYLNKSTKVMVDDQIFML